MIPYNFNYLRQIWWSPKVLLSMNVRSGLAIRKGGKSTYCTYPPNCLQRKPRAAAMPANYRKMKNYIEKEEMGLAVDRRALRKGRVSSQCG
jgi:hypothetical protein